MAGVKCPQCGSAMKTRRENFSYTASGLSGITLMNVEVSRCSECGEFEVNIPNIEGLHRAIARFIVERVAKLSAAEIVFLRKYLGWSGAEFARHMGVSPETVSRWERGRDSISGLAERALRLMVASRKPFAGEYPLETLRELSNETEVVRLGARASARGWELRLA